MADKKISQMTAMTSGQIANNDNIVIADTSENHTKRAESTLPAYDTELDTAHDKINCIE